METRKGNIIVGTAGGTAGKNAKTYKVSLPTPWLMQMGINETEKEVILSFDGHRITLQKHMDLAGFLQDRLAQGHRLKMISYYNGDTLCTQICADFTDRQIAIRNEDVPNQHRAFGANDTPSWDDLTDFLEERCIPRQRDGLRHYLDALGLDAYDPFEIVLRTGGRIAEDHQWLKVEDPV